MHPQRYNLIKLTHYDETKKRAHDSQVELRKTSKQLTEESEKVKQ